MSNLWLGITANYLFLLASVHSSALLSANIKTLQVAACETEDLLIKCPTKTTIHIQFANYGRLVSSRERPCHNAGTSSKGLHGARGNFSIFHTPYDIAEESRECIASGSRERVVAMCQDKRSCRIPVNVETFKQDPCPRTWKYLEVAYKCKPNVFHDQVVCEGDHMKLECEMPTHRLAIQSAMFGRDRSGGNSICPDKSTRDTQSASGFTRPNSECMSSFAAEMAMTKCQGERICTLYADEATFGNQCPPGTRKYLSISYACVPQKLLINPSSRPTKEPAPRFEEKGDDYSYLTGDRDDDNSLIPRPLNAIDMQAIQPDTSRGGPGGADKKAFAVTDDAGADRKVPCNCTENVSFWMDWVVTYQKISRNQTSCLIYAGVAAGIGLLIFIFVVVLHIIVRRRAKKRAESQHITSSQSSSSKLNAKTKDQRMPLYSTRYAEENEEAESLQPPVDLTSRYTPRVSLPRASSMLAEGKRPMDASRSMHRLTTDGSFYS
ncbi:putative Protein eva-1-like protein C [Hypsibius exemplaris]|uniref:SUEL-type lectin domain-containing protein n=1 Tax=Hypsibius exemplaris TaxID=2072580 RepID=A0A9X6NEF4_HYPEX|nr:putative Protein eva-1-like protein C [Hypsibius exemplaris]